jgi:hypothetical protein
MVKVTLGGVFAFTHPSYAATKDANVVFLELLIYIVPDQTSSDRGCTRSSVVGHLRKPFGVYLDPLC